MVHLFVVWVVSGKSLGVVKKAKKKQFYDNRVKWSDHYLKFMFERRFL